ncbi:hypothetical protein HK105_207412 [Polyrhizophydium stewartii]|uniref:Uncharacterized protein n=1 Tax=Polyrhizophydium stewartii TaxID=2732419 RepID=A0ABR4N0M8_9FUNG
MLQAPVPTWLTGRSAARGSRLILATESCLDRPPSVCNKAAIAWPAKNYDAKNLIMHWSLCHCGHCDTVWCHYKNARINTHLRAMFYLQQPLKVDAHGNPAARQDGPPYLRQQQQVQA